MRKSKLQNPSLRKRKGFTLIELIVVIAILAILAAIAIPTFLGTLANARRKTDAASARVIASAVMLKSAEENWTIASITNANLMDDTAGLGKYLDEEPVGQSTYGTDFSVVVTGGEMTVLLGTTEFYPSYPTS